MTEAESSNNRRPRFDAQDVRDALPAIDAGLFALSHVPGVAPYAGALRVVTAIGQVALPNEQKILLAKLKLVREQITELEKSPKTNARAIKSLRTQMDVYVDLLTENAP